jgi:hypothetical protein
MEPDIEELFAPIAPSAAYGVVLDEAQDVLTAVRAPVDAELWGSDTLGALTRTVSEDQVAADFVPLAEKAATPGALALLRVFASLGSAELRKSATQSAERIIATGVADQPWAAGLGTPQPGACWRYGDVSGQQESVTVTFAYGVKEHALSVLIDHNSDGKIRDVWVNDAAGLLDKTFLAAENDEGVTFEKITPAQAGEKLRQAFAAGEAPRKPDQSDDIRAHRAFLRSRVMLLNGGPLALPGAVS